ncbi:Rpn family recombination-promoting nuclease/putative transposase [Paenibacillus planticolens]|uniref:Rpn family recombination-promoting nuclease/putative transposase n=1 Tax=Paenibacillus planticolens TaxID=2654976 RepID=A0ABX1ZLC3_9BACL|nr:Rpn family recombination-promoting nuclease/putative transposase [Paenibacillus planticolens]NOV00894.1 Rpn family recombination-promoting nuclease/putative transposase [Paenibacillus planticolens]
MRDLLDPKNDFVFKRIFGSEENKDVLLAFLNRTFQEAGEPTLSEIILMNPYTDKDSPQDKQSIFDIQAKTAEGKLINIEMQLFNRYDNEKRTLYYWSKQYASQLEEGQSYKNLKKCVTINILNFSILPNDRYYNVFHFREDNTGIFLTDDLEIQFLELSKLNHQQTAASGGLLNWLLFLNSDNTDNWEVLKMQEPKLGKAMTVLEFLSQDAEARRLYEMRQKALHDEASSMEGAREEGEKKGKLEVASKMLAKGMDLESVSELTGISIVELKKLTQAH